MKVWVPILSPTVEDGSVNVKLLPDSIKDKELYNLNFVFDIFFIKYVPVWSPIKDSSWGE